MSQMRLYYYRVLLPHGALKQGLLQLMVERDHSARLRIEQETEGTVLTLRRLPGWMLDAGSVLRRVGGRGLRMEDLAGLLRDLSLMLAAGVPAIEALRTLVEEGGQTGQHAAGRVAKRLADDLMSGIPMAAAFERQPDVFPETVRNLVAIGDQSGTLDRMLAEAAEHVERMVSIRRDIRTAMIYPIFVFATIFAVAAFWVYYVVPNMARLFRQLNAKLPPITEGLVRFSDALAEHALVAALVVVVLAAATAYVFVRVPRAKVVLHEVLHRLPITRVLMTASGMAHLTEHLAILVRAGLEFVSCLDILERSTRDRYYRHRLRRVREAVARGERISLAMRRVGGFPAMAVRMIAVGEESGSLDQQLTHLAVEYRKRLDTLIKSLSEIIKPAIILVAGGLFLFLIVALLLPVYDLVQQSVQQSLGAR